MRQSGDAACAELGLWAELVAWVQPGSAVIVEVTQTEPGQRAVFVTDPGQAPCIYSPAVQHCWTAGLSSRF